MKKKLFTLALAGVAALGLASCGGNSSNPTTTAAPQATTTDAPAATTTDAPAATTSETPVSTSKAETHPEDLVALNDYKLNARLDLKFDFETVDAEKDNFAAGVYEAAKAKYDAGIEAINAATSIAGVKAAYDSAVEEILEAIPSATGVFDYTKLSTAERTKLTSVVERYAVATGLTGLTLYETGGYQLVNPRVTLGTQNYILSYGFGTLAEGSINADLDSEPNAAWKRYYHSFETSDPATANYWNDKGAQVGDIYGYFNASLFTTFMNTTKDSYVWVGELSKDDRPVAVDPNPDGTSTTWKVKIKTGADGLKYNTLSNKENRAAFNNRLVSAEDYLTAYKLQLTQANALFRGSEYAGQTGVKIKGLTEYYNATESLSNQNALWDEGLWTKHVGDNLKVFQDGDDWYFQWTNTQATNAFYAMYYIAGTMYSPIPMEFVETVTLKNLFGYNSDKTETPVDNSLSLGAYTLEVWNSNSEIVLKKNPNYVFADTKYSIPGVHLNILTAIANDEDAAVKEFLAGNLDACTITQNYLKEYKNDPRSHFYGSGSNFKLNLNTASEETWEYYFGTNGVVSKTPESDYWDVEPALSNKHFVKALSYALNRQLVANAHASVPSCSYLGGVYMSDPENGEFYNSTQAHKDAISFITEDTDGYGYSLQLAIENFQYALAELEAEGKIERGTPDNPTVITLEIAWMYPYQEQSYHAEVKQQLESAFNYPTVSDGCYQLNVEFWAGQEWSDVYYNKLMMGQFDLGFGSISGNSYNILDYLSVLSADQSLSGGFTLNWGPQTDSDDQYFLIYDGYKWSFDNLIKAANTLVILKDGEEIDSIVFADEDYEYKLNEDGTAEIEFTLEYPNVISDVELSVDLVGFGYKDGSGKSADYTESSLVVGDNENLTLTYALDDNKIKVKLTVSAADLTKYTTTNYYPNAQGVLCVDVYVTFKGKYQGTNYTFADNLLLDSLFFKAASAE